MTATITPPPGIPHLARRDPEVRLNDYCDALAFYLDVPSQYIDRILFIDNSASDVTALHRVADGRRHGKRVEIVSFNGNDHPHAYGKCYGEFKLMDYGLAQATFLRPGDTLWKVTGRLRVLNIHRLVASEPRGCAVYCDLRHVPLPQDWLRASGRQWMDPRLFACTVEAYDRLFRGRYPELRTDLVGIPERTLFQMMIEARHREYIVPRFRIQPAYAGHGARRNIDYNRGAYRYKHLFRAAVRRVAPWLWI